MRLRFWVYQLRFFYIHPLSSPHSGAPSAFPFHPPPSVSLGRSSMPSSLERPDALRSGSASHLYRDAGVPSAKFPFPATGSLTPVAQIAVSYLAMESRHLPLAAAASATAGPTASHTRSRTDSYAAMTGPSDLRDSCKALFWSERLRSDIDSHVGRMFHTAAEGSPHLTPQPLSNLDCRASGPIAFREMAVQFRMDTYLLRRDRFIEAMGFASIQARVDHSLKNSVGRERAWLVHWTHMGDFM